MRKRKKRRNYRIGGMINDKKKNKKHGRREEGRKEQRRQENSQ